MPASRGDAMQTANENRGKKSLSASEIGRPINSLDLVSQNSTEQSRVIPTPPYLLGTMARK
eukprot:scaffold4946_cov139-Skeletonema_dohrnii-CCMP3373.AAC.9